MYSILVLPLLLSFYLQLSARGGSREKVSRWPIQAAAAGEAKVGQDQTIQVDGFAAIAFKRYTYVHILLYCRLTETLRSLLC